GSRVSERGQGTTITEAFRSDGRGRIDDTQYRIVSEADAALRIETDQYGEQQYPEGYRSYTYTDRQANPDGYYGNHGTYRQSPYQQQPQPQYQQQPQYGGRGLFGSWSSQPPPQPQQQPQRRFDPDYIWHNRVN